MAVRAGRRTQADRRGRIVIGNIIWFILAGWWLAIAQVAFGVVLCITIIGIPFGIASFKMAGLAVAPLGKEIVSRDDVRARNPCTGPVTRRKTASQPPGGRRRGGLTAALRDHGTRLGPTGLEVAEDDGHVRLPHAGPRG